MPLIDIAHHQDQGLGAARAPSDRLRRNEPQHYVFDSNQRLNASSIASFLSSLNAGTFARKVSTNTTRRPPVQSLDAAGQRDGCRHPEVNGTAKLSERCSCTAWAKSKDIRPSCSWSPRRCIRAAVRAYGFLATRT